MHRRLFVTSLALALFCVVGTHSAYAKRYCLQGQLSWSRLSEQNLRVDKWSLCRG